MAIRKSPVNPGDQRTAVVARAIADPAFRRRLFAKPETIFGGRLTAQDNAALERIKRAVPAINDLISGLASDLLCNGGGCPGLA